MGYVQREYDCAMSEFVGGKNPTVLTSFERTQKTEPHGCFAFFEVSPGEHEIEVSAAKGKAKRKKIIAKAGVVVKVGFEVFD